MKDFETMLSRQAIKEFQEIYFDECGEEIPFEEATSKAESLLRFYKSAFKKELKGDSTDE